MRNNEKFIKRWEKYRKKGKLKYILTNIIIYILVYWLTCIIFIVINGYDFHRLTKYLPTFIGALMGYTIMSPINWNRNEKRYCNLLKNQ